MEKIKGAIKGVQDSGWSDWGERFGVALCLGSTRKERQQTRLNEMKVGHPTSNSEASSSVVSTQEDPKEAVCRLSKEKRDALYVCSTVGCEAGVDICEDKSCEEEEESPKDEAAAAAAAAAPEADQWYNTPPDWCVGGGASGSGLLSPRRPTQVEPNTARVRVAGANHHGAAHVVHVVAGVEGGVQRVALVQRASLLVRAQGSLGTNSSTQRDEMGAPHIPDPPPS